MMFQSNRLNQSPSEADFCVDITEDNVGFCAVVNDIAATARHTVFHVIYTCPGCVAGGKSIGIGLCLLL